MREEKYLRSGVVLYLSSACAKVLGLKAYYLSHLPHKKLAEAVREMYFLQNL